MTFQCSGKEYVQIEVTYQPIGHLSSSATQLSSMQSDNRLTEATKLGVPELRKFLKRLRSASQMYMEM